MNSKKIVILGTGGTIAGRAARAGDNVGYTAGEVAVDQLVADLPLPADVMVSCEQVAQIDSKDMSVAVWQRLLVRVAHHLQENDVDGVVITHGTDTLEETAVFLQLALASSGLLCKPVVLTCAMRPATALVPDGPQNLLDALAVAQQLATRPQGKPAPQCFAVMAVCAGVVHSALEVQKTHPYRTDAFTSGDSGPLGFVEEGVVRWVRSVSFDTVFKHVPWAMFAIDRVASREMWPRVEIVLSHAGADGRIVDLLVAEATAHPAQAVRGVVVASTGNGTVHQALMAALTRAESAGVRVVYASRCAEGRIVPTPGSGRVDSQGLSAAKARVALQLTLLHED